MKEKDPLDIPENKKFRINHTHRKRLTYFLKKFYENQTAEKYTIFHFVRYFKQRLKEDKLDAWISVSGDTGVGKSYFVLMTMILFGRPMNLVDNVAYIPRGNQIMKMFDKLNFQSLLIDEAARELRSVNWQSKQQQGVNMKAMTDRFKNNLVFLNMPNFAEFTKSMKRGNIQFRAILPFRDQLTARVFIQRKSRNWRSPDPWGDEKLNKIYEKSEKRFKGLDNDQILHIERSSHAHVMDFSIPDLSIILPDVINEYERLKKLSREEDPQEISQESKDKYRKKYEDLMAEVSHLLLDNPLQMGTVQVTRARVAKALGISVATLDNYRKRRKERRGRDTERFYTEIENKKRPFVASEGSSRPLQ